MESSTAGELDHPMHWYLCKKKNKKNMTNSFAGEFDNPVHGYFLPHDSRFLSSLRQWREGDLLFL